VGPLGQPKGCVSVFHGKFGVGSMIKWLPLLLTLDLACWTALVYFGYHYFFSGCGA
tara:strand:- start:1092 stop:1259 length:168 start_codon:yes stop_codon:yes gene_type:complete